MIGRLLLTAGVVGVLGSVAITVNYIEVLRKETDAIRATFESVATAQATATQLAAAQLAQSEHRRRRFIHTTRHRCPRTQLANSSILLLCTLTPEVVVDCVRCRRCHIPRQDISGEILH